MSWSIADVVNTVYLPNECVHDLFEKGQDYQGDLWDEVGDVVDENGRLRFNPDHMEHMDYLDTHDDVVKILKRYEVEGDICFGSLDGDNAGSFWGYRFDGQGGMEKLSGRLVWDEKVEFMKGKTVVVTGSLSPLTREDVEEKIRDAGGKTSSTVSKKTNLLVVGDAPGSKLEQAKKLGIETIGAKDFLALLEQ